MRPGVTDLHIPIPSLSQPPARPFSSVRKSEDQRHSPDLGIMELGGDIMLTSALSMILAMSPQKDGEEWTLEGKG